MMAKRFAEPVLVFVTVLCGYLLTASNDLRHNGDTFLRYQTTQALVDYHRAWIADPAWRDSRVSLGIGHHLYAFYAPGQAVMMAPLYVVGKVAAHHLHLAYDTATLYATRSVDLWLGALLALVFYLMCRRAGYGRVVSSTLTLILAFATVMWPDAQSALEQTQVTLFVLVAVLCTWQFVGFGPRSRWWLALAGAASGAAVLTRYDAAIYVPPLVIYVVVVRARRHDKVTVFSDVGAYAAGIVPCLVGVALWDVLRFGSPFLTGLSETTFGEPFLTGLAGLLVSPGKGLIWYLPLVVLVPFGIRRFMRRTGSLTLVLSSLVLLPVLFYANVMYWHGDPSWGPRYLYTAVPYLILPLGDVLNRWQRLRLYSKTAVFLLILISVGLNLAAVSVTQWRFWYRLQATLQNQSSAAQWSGEPFHWGAQHYHYYWIPRQSPILLQVDDLYQVIRLQLFGERRYVLSGHPDPYTASSPADNYSINTLAFWWADDRHPLFGPHTRSVLAAALLALFALSVGLLGYSLRTRSSETELTRQEREVLGWRQAET